MTPYLCTRCLRSRWHGYVTTERDGAGRSVRREHLCRSCLAAAGLKSNIDKLGGRSDA